MDSFGDSEDCLDMAKNKLISMGPCESDNHHSQNPENSDKELYKEYLLVIRNCSLKYFKSQNSLKSYLMNESMIIENIENIQENDEYYSIIETFSL